MNTARPPNMETIVKQHVAADTYILTYTTNTERKIVIALKTPIGQRKLSKLMLAAGMEKLSDSLELVGRTFNPEDAF